MCRIRPQLEHESGDTVVATFPCKDSIGLHVQKPSGLVMTEHFFAAHVDTGGCVCRYTTAVGLQ